MHQANLHSIRSGKSKVILLVEDHDVYRQVVRAAMGKYLPEFEMLDVGCVAAALSILKLRKIDVLVADMTLPDGSAIELVEQVGQCIEQGMRVIVFSCNSSAEMLPVLSRTDVHGYVSKDQGLKALAQVILNTIDGGVGGDLVLAEQESALRMN